MSLRLNVREVKPEYFVTVIRNFEARYGMDWATFAERFRSGNIDPDRENEEFIEWSFLCEQYLPLLLRLDGTSPPGKDLSSCENEPRPGALFFGVWQRAIQHLPYTGGERIEQQLPHHNPH